MQMAELQHTRRTSAVSTCAAVSTGSSRVARTILAEEVVAARKQLPAGPPQHVGPAGGARRHRKSTAFARAANAHCTHMHTWTRASAWSVCARGCACARMQQDAERHSPRRDGSRSEARPEESATWTAEEVSLFAINGNVPLVF